MTLYQLHFFHFHMATGNSSYSASLMDQETGENRGLKLFIILLLIVSLGAGGYFLLFPAEKEIELAPPLGQTIDPIIRARLEAAKQVEAEQNRRSMAAKAAADDGRQLSQDPVETPAPTPATGSPSVHLQALLSQINEPLTGTVEPVIEPATVEIPQWIRDQENAQDGEIARTLIESVRRGKTTISLSQLHERAKQLETAGKATDAYLLYFYAARQGDGLSAFALGSLNDPAHFTSGNNLLAEPDPVQAHKWYTIAASSQIDGAQQRLRQLHASMESAATAGDTTAQRLLLNWK